MLKRFHTAYIEFYFCLNLRETVCHVVAFGNKVSQFLCLLESIFVSFVVNGYVQFRVQFVLNSSDVAVGIGFEPHLSVVDEAEALCKSSRDRTRNAPKEGTRACYFTLWGRHYLLCSTVCQINVEALILISN